MSTDTPVTRVKIAFLITTSTWGGSQKNVYDIVTHLDPKKFDVVVILGGQGHLKKKLSEVGIRTITVYNLEKSINFKRDVKSFFEIYTLLKQEKPDILHLHNTKAAAIGSLIGRVRRIKKIIYTVHGWAFNEDRPLYQRGLILFSSWITTILSTHIVTISKSETDLAKQFPYIATKITYIPNGVREQSVLRENSAREYIEQRIGMSLKDKFVVGMIGELHKNKGYIYAIHGMAEVLKTNPHAVMVIIGAGVQHEMLQQKIDQLNLKSHIFLLGFIENATQYTKAFDTLLLSSIKEGLPYTLLETGLAGTPLISTTVGGTSEIIDDMRSGILIQPAKAQEIAYAITFMIEHPDIRLEYARNIAKKIKSEYGLQKMIQSVERLYVIEAPKIRAS